MNITEVRVRRINTDGKMKGVASITFDNAFVVRDIRIIEGQKGLFVAMPSRKTPDGTFRDVAHPISSAAREQIQSAILEEFETLKDESDYVAQPEDRLDSHDVDAASRDSDDLEDTVEV